MASIGWDQRAIDDLTSIKAYIGSNSPTYASRVVRDIIEATRRLESFPRSGSIVPEINDPDIREVIFHSYRIIYLVRNDVCRVVAVIHASRDLLRQVNPRNWAQP